MRSRYGRQRTAVERRQVVAGHEASGQTVEDYCTQAGVSTSSFYRWRAESPRSSVIEARADTPRFVQLTASAPRAESVWDVEVELGGGVVLRLRHR